MMLPLRVLLHRSSRHNREVAAEELTPLPGAPSPSNGLLERFLLGEDGDFLWRQTPTEQVRRLLLLLFLLVHRTAFMSSLLGYCDVLHPRACPALDGLVVPCADTAGAGPQGMRHNDDFFIAAASIIAQGTPEIRLQPTALHQSSHGYFR
ncbi:hypothetical protein cyc_09114 [Cyclospora cayetanensis]|uniref:Uncharacterized protein n=1 Tax=Cyclospora cayetanensis TaxID=88456 RepID=A0A1D3D045_9EIME|nr:hypothetical protein cyc_09114 [Cyclospora cayetanensis]